MTTGDILDISSLKNALRQLVDSYQKVVEVREGGEPREYYPFFRAATIQAYEYTYELSIKMMQRCIEMYGATEEEAPRRFTDFLRIASEYHLLKDVIEWEEYRKGRNKTSHTYDEEVAEKLLAIVPKFIISATEVVASLQEHIDASHS
jgi:nucleotidyltransferase substrate binding protein (TIGR01987 family)